MAKSGPERPGRVRAFKPKVSTGCKTCKIRRVKCDEGKPSCKRCSSTGRKCDGYFYSGVPSGTTTRLTPPTATNQNLHSTKSSIDVSPSLTFLDTNIEQRSFDFFHQNTIPQLSSIFGSPSWKQLNRLLLQAAYHEPAVRHASVALGALHETFELSSRPLLSSNEETTNTQFAVQQYVKALGYLVNPAIRRGKPAADVALITCILFVCFEVNDHSRVLSTDPDIPRIFVENTLWHFRTSTVESRSSKKSHKPHQHQSLRVIQRIQHHRHRQYHSKSPRYPTCHCQPSV